MNSLDIRTFAEINKDLAARTITLRKRKKISQAELASRSGVSLGSIRRFESEGEISLRSLTKIAIALEVENEIDSLFTEVPFNSLEELMNEQDR